MFMNLNLSTKISFAMSFLIFGMFVIAFVGYKGIHKIGEEIAEISEFEAPLLNSVVEIEKDILKSEILIGDMIIFSNQPQSKEFENIENRITNLTKETNKQILRCQDLTKKALLHASSKDLFKVYNYTLDLCKKFQVEQKYFEDNLILFENSIKQGNTNNLITQRENILNDLKKMDQQVIELVHNMEKLSLSLSNQAKQDEKNVVLTIEIVSIMIFLGAIIVALLLNKNIKKLINEFQNGLIDFFRYLNKETNEIKPLNDKCNDEIGQMSKVINQNIIKIKKVLDEDNLLIEDAQNTINRVKHGCYSQTITHNTSNQSLNEFKNGVNEMIIATKKHFKQMNEVLEKYTQYDYRSDLKLDNIEKDGLFDLLIKDINKLKNSITQMLVENKKNGLILQDSSNMLLQNVEVLNTNSNEAASSLKQTSISLEEVTSNIKSNTANVSQMVQYANNLSSSSNKGQNLAKETTKAMDEINSEVIAINEAISVIDQISFQTNILSLNAAVEAATAGESGKSFAVVAQEVRNLATRSAIAAKEIKDLVQKATLKADEGKNIADLMINGYDELNENITNTLDIINNIENSSKEQEKSILQINYAINDLDKQTQQNASIATQTNNIALGTDQVAKLIVKNSDEKEFIGKDTINIKS